MGDMVRRRDGDELKNVTTCTPTYDTSQNSKHSIGQDLHLAAAFPSKFRAATFPDAAVNGAPKIWKEDSEQNLKVDRQILDGPRVPRI